MNRPIPPMPLTYALGWWAALVILFGPGGARMDYYSSVGGIFASLTIITVASYALARIGWRRGWFRKPF